MVCCSIPFSKCDGWHFKDIAYETIGGGGGGGGGGGTLHIQNEIPISVKRGFFFLLASTLMIKRFGGYLSLPQNKMSPRFTLSLPSGKYGPIMIKLCH